MRTWARFNGDPSIVPGPACNIRRLPDGVWPRSKEKLLSLMDTAEREAEGYRAFMEARLARFDSDIQLLHRAELGGVEQTPATTPGEVRIEMSVPPPPQQHLQNGTQPLAAVMGGLVIGPPLASWV